jgi:hypothetical protein
LTVEELIRKLKELPQEALIYTYDHSWEKFEEAHTVELTSTDEDFLFHFVVVK